MDKTTIWRIVRDERAALCDDLDSFSADEWGAPTACPGWSVHDVVAHLVDTAKTTRRSFVTGLAAARFDFDRQNEAGVRRERRADPRHTVEEFRRVLDRTTTPPANLATRLVEAIVHGEDIRRAVGRRGSYPVEAIVAALDYQLRTSVSMGGGKQRAAGLHVQATDADIPRGDGPLVRGSALALLLSVSGRAVAADELSGEGVPQMTARVASPG